MVKKYRLFLCFLIIASFLIASCSREEVPDGEALPTKESALSETIIPTEEMVVTKTPTDAEQATELISTTEAPTNTFAPTETPVSQLSGTVTLWHSWNEDETASLSELITAFQDQNPSVQFDVLSVPFDDLRAKYEEAALDGGGPTILIGASDWGPALFDTDFVADLSGLAKQDLLDSINDAALGAVQYKSAIIGMPEITEGYVLFRNTAIIPEAPATWDDLVAAAQSATQGDVVGADLERGFFFSAAHLDGIGGDLMTDAGDPAFNNEKGIEWINLLTNFSEAGPTEYYTDNDLNLFKEGRIGFIFESTAKTSELAEAIGIDNLSIDPWPFADGGNLSGYVQTENIYLSTNARGADRDASWAFIEFFMSPEAQKILADPTKAGRIPTIKDIEISDRLLQEAMIALMEGTTLPVIPEVNAYWGPMDIALQSVFNGNADPATALAIAEEAIRNTIEEIRSGDQ
jgi:arabinogalactan oligomer/maltooligosaccharide transport system substrate-binding protein